MAGKYLLDTNIVVGLFNGDAHIEKRITSVPEIYLSSVVLGELHFGARSSGRPEANTTRIEDFASSCTVLEITPETGRQYGLLKSSLKRQGRPIPENDIWIAASALKYGLTLVSRDSHFEHCERLRLEAW